MRNDFSEISRGTGTYAGLLLLLRSLQQRPMLHVCAMDNRRSSNLLALWLLVSAVYGAVSPVALDLRAVPRANAGARNKLARRDGPVGVDLAFHDNIFYANASLGTPQQRLQFIVDPNSADLLAPAPSDPACDNGACAFGTYKANSSSTYDLL